MFVYPSHFALIVFWGYDITMSLTTTIPRLVKKNSNATVISQKTMKCYDVFCENVKIITHSS